MSKTQGKAARSGATGAAERVATQLLHEMRNVLNPIVSAAWLLEANAGDPDKVRELAKRIEEFAKADSRLAQRMRELLAAEGLGEAAAGARPATSPSS